MWHPNTDSVARAARVCRADGGGAGARPARDCAARRGVCGVCAAARRRVSRGRARRAREAAAVPVAFMPIVRLCQTRRRATSTSPDTVHETKAHKANGTPLILNKDASMV
eukprot:2666652-Prymnesium_polylepis.2